MASASVTGPAATEADIISDLLKKSFSVRPIAKQNTTTNPQFDSNIQGESISGELVCEEGLALWQFYFKKVVLLALSFVLPWKVANVDEVWL